MKQIVMELVQYAATISANDPDFDEWDNYNTFAESVQRKDATEGDYQTAFIYLQHLREQHERTT